MSTKIVLSASPESVDVVCIQSNIVGITMSMTWYCSGLGIFFHGVSVPGVYVFIANQE